MDPNELAKDLRSKGWTEDEIQHALNALKDAPETKGRVVRFLDTIIYFLALFLTLIGNFAIAVMLVPFMLVAQPVFLYPILIVIGVTFGALYDNIIKDILDIESAPKILPQLFLPAIALIAVFIMVQLNNYLAELLKLPLGVHEPIFMGVFYTAGFMLPYYFTWQKKRQAQAPPPPPSWTRETL